ncbi:LAME_0F10352g1_1 [Lachancea meyersii CBS 8951]|uniref:LAME_0F10352g1_1 n=1 Tax=Lachancea meyersii CBS 8951 TaxID=1266667 RepID=A0A1G4JVF5_9SACH|nr:LAME_0F10352g1_1 [Lachancea meyersii CBS 8951]
MSYSQYAGFLQDEIDRYQSFQVPQLEGLDADVARSIQLTLARELAQQQQDAFRLVNRDKVLLEIQENERDLLRQDLNRIMACVGDLPRERVGADLIELQEARDGKFVSLEQLMKDIDNLPHISVVDSEDLDSESLLKEYNELRDGLKNKARAIRDASNLAPELKRQLDLFTNLEHAIQREGSEPSDYYTHFKQNVIAQAQETAKLVETVLKKDGKLPKDAVQQLNDIISTLELMR